MHYISAEEPEEVESKDVTASPPVVVAFCSRTALQLPVVRKVTVEAEEPKADIEHVEDILAEQPGPVPNSQVVDEELESAVSVPAVVVTRELIFPSIPFCVYVSMSHELLVTQGPPIEATFLLDFSFLYIDSQRPWMYALMTFTFSPLQLVKTI